MGLQRRTVMLLGMLQLVLFCYWLRPFGLARLHDDSMEPVLHDGQICLWVRPMRIEIGDVLLAWDQGEVVMHRVVEFDLGDSGQRLYGIEGDRGMHSCIVGGAQIMGKVIWPDTARRRGR